MVNCEKICTEWPMLMEAYIDWYESPSVFLSCNQAISGLITWVE